MFENLELHAAATVLIPACIMLARQLAEALPGKRAFYANFAAQFFLAAGIAIGMAPETLGAGEMMVSAGVFGLAQFLASWGIVEGLKAGGGDIGNELVKGKTGTGDGRRR